MQESGIIEIAVYTAGTQDYADDILSNIDPEGQIKYRFYRHDCEFDKETQTLKKDLRKVQKVVMQDSQIS